MGIAALTARLPLSPYLCVCTLCAKIQSIATPTVEREGQQPRWTRRATDLMERKKTLKKSLQQRQIPLVILMTNPRAPSLQTRHGKMFLAQLTQHCEWSVSHNSRLEVIGSLPQELIAFKIVNISLSYSRSYQTANAASSETLFSL